jgi:hypothetical protein
LQLVPRPSRTRGNRFLVLVAGLLVSGLIGLLLLNLSMQKGAFELAGIQQQTADLRTSEQALAYDMQRLESTSSLWRRAADLGMVLNTTPVFLDLTDGSIIGDPVPASAPVVVAPEPVQRQPPGVAVAAADTPEPAGDASASERGEGRRP